jgi:circadian clock protein KaiC
MKKLKLQLHHTGIAGLDQLLGGGLPYLSFNIISGEPGSGKSTFAQQIMFHLATPQRPALFFTAMGEPSLKMLRYQQQFDFFDFDKVDHAIRYIDLSPEMEGGNYERILNKILSEVKSFTPGIVLIDSFRSFMHAASGDLKQTAQLQLFVQKLALHMTGWDATTFLIGEYVEEEREKNPIFTIADGIFWLSQNLYRNAIVRKIRVVKMRGLAQSPGLHTFRINKKGIEIFPRAISPVDPVHLQLKKAPATALRRLSTGVPALDEMMGGGLPAGYSMLLVGPSGSGKTLLATQFLLEGVRQAEPGIIALFEKNPHQLRNDLMVKLVSEGHVGILNMRALDLSIDETLYELVNMIHARKAKRIVFDSLSAFELALAPEFREDFRESLYRMISVLTDKGVTIVMTTELEDRFSELRFSPYGSAFLADAIVMQRYFEISGQLKTLISVVKLRGSLHSRDLRSFEINADGFTIGAQALPYEKLLTGASMRAWIDKKSPTHFLSEVPDGPQG